MEIEDGHGVHEVLLGKSLCCLQGAAAVKEPFHRHASSGDQRREVVPVPASADHVCMSFYILFRRDQKKEVSIGNGIPKCK